MRDERPRISDKGRQPADEPRLNRATGAGQAALSGCFAPLAIDSISARSRSTLGP
jgi:hypothetical protein